MAASASTWKSDEPGVSVVDAAGDADADALLRQTTVDPVQAQRDAQALYGGSVNWAAANWSNSILKQLGGLSSLSNHDLPHAAHLRRRLISELPIEHDVVRTAAAGSLSHTTLHVTPYVPDLELRHADGCESAGVSRLASVYGVPSPTRPAPQPNPIRPLPTVASVTAPLPSAVASSALAPLLNLSPDLLANDPALAELVRRLAVTRKDVDPRAAQLLSGGVVDLPDDVHSAKLTQAERLRAEAARRSVVSPNRAFCESDIVAYDALRARTVDAPASMHDVGRVTWHEKRLELEARDEDRDAFSDYREELTQATGRLMAVSERNEALASRERTSRVLALADKAEADAIVAHDMVGGILARVDGGAESSS